MWWKKILACEQWILLNKKFMRKIISFFQRSSVNLWFFYKNIFFFLLKQILKLITHEWVVTQSSLIFYRIFYISKQQQTKKHQPRQRIMEQREEKEETCKIYATEQTVILLSESKLKSNLHEIKFFFLTISQNMKGLISG